MNKYFYLLFAFVALIALLAFGLTLNPRDVPSPLIHKKAPAFSLPVLNENKNFSTQEMLGKIWLLNVWASWCVSCRVEHPVLVDFAKQNTVVIVGLNYKEIKGDASLNASKLSLEEEMHLATQRANQWLNEKGNPYFLSVLDLNGKVGLDYGVYGVPETFLIDANGMIQFKHLGPITPDVLQNKLLPQIEKLKNQ